MSATDVARGAAEARSTPDGAPDGAPSGARAGGGAAPEPGPPDPPGFLARLAWLWWVYLPLALRRLADGLATTLVDGLYLVAWPLPAFLLPPLVLLLAVLLGATHPGYVVTVTESIPLLLL